METKEKDWMLLDTDCTVGMSLFACPECGRVQPIGGLGNLTPVECDHSDEVGHGENIGMHRLAIKRLMQNITSLEGKK